MNVVKGSNLLHLVWQPLLNHLVVLKQSVVMGNTFTGHESSVPEDASVTRLCLTNAFLAGQTNTTSNPPPFANDQIFCPLRTPRSPGDTSTTPGLCTGCWLALSSNTEDARWNTSCTWRRCTGWTARSARSYTVLLNPIAVDQFLAPSANTVLF